MNARPDLLVLRLSSLGDVLFALPAVGLLRDQGALGRLAWLVEDRAASLLSELFPVDELVVFPRRRKAAWPGHMRRLLARRDDVVLDLQTSFKSRMQRLFLRAPRQLGFDAPLAREGAERSLTERLQPPAGARHRVDTNLAALPAFGLEPPARAPRPTLTVDRDEAARLRRELTPPGGGPLVVLHPGTSAFGAFKRWPVAAFARLADALGPSRGARLLVSGTGPETALVDELLASTHADAQVLRAGSLGAFAATLAAADLVVAADSFPLHLANALGTPVVGLFGPKDPAVNGPYWDRSRVVRSGWDCSPCTLRRCAGAPCMTRLDPAAVLAACQELLDEGAT